MSPRRKRWLSVVLIVLGLMLLEVGVRFMKRPRVGIVLTNEAGATARNIVARYGAIKLPVGELAPGGSTVVRLENGPEEDVTLAFEQEGNPTPGIVVDGPELETARRDGTRMVLILRPNEIVRHMEEDPDADVSFLMRLFRGVRDTLFPEEDPTSGGPPSPVRSIIRRLLGMTLPTDARRGILAGWMDS